MKRSTAKKRVKKSAVPPTQKTDRRLLGIWQSDRRRTLKELRYRPGLTPKKRKFFRDLFGHLRVKYGRTKVQGVLKDYRFVEPYEVLATDETSVAVRTYSDVTKEWYIQHIHFEGGRHFWISFGLNREWFKRIKDSKKL